MTTELSLHWQDPIWLQEVYEWIHAQADRQGISVTGDIEQPHIYPWSTVLRCVASIVKAIMWHGTVAPLKGALRKEYSQIVPELFQEFMEYEKRL